MALTFLSPCNSSWTIFHASLALVAPRILGKIAYETPLRIILWAPAPLLLFSFNSFCWASVNSDIDLGISYPNSIMSHKSMKTNKVFIFIQLSHQKILELEHYLVYITCAGHISPSKSPLFSFQFSTPNLLWT